jgi:hypothetical protein
LEEEKGLTPRERYRRKIERDLEGVWQVEQLGNPAFPQVENVQGYFLFYREYVAYTVTASVRSNVLTTLEEGLFQSGFKKYTVTEDARFLLQNLIGVQRLGSPTTERPLGGEVEERQIVFLERDAVRIGRAADDYVQLRKVATGPPAPRKPFPRPRAFPRRESGKTGEEETPATRPVRRDG